MVSKRLDEAIHDPVERTYLSAIDGVWADLVIFEFAFLEDRSGSLDAIAFHQKGDYIHYSGPWGSVLLEFMPDASPMWLSSHASLHGHAGEFVGRLDTLREMRLPDQQAPSVQPLDETTIAAFLRSWAEVLRQATDLF